jgi:serine protein kinase
MDARRFLDEVESAVTGRYVRDRSLLSFDEYLQGFLEGPRRQARGAAQYLLDVFDHYGTHTRETPVGPLRRFDLFDAPFADGRGRVAGQEQVQNDLYRILRNFVRQGKADRLIMLHGPNGSAKSSIVTAILAGLEAYSRTPEGAVYRFNWVFPNEKIVKGAIGFGGGAPKSDRGVDSFAHLEGEDIEARLVCDLKDHPLLLIPVDERRRVLESACRPKNGDEAEDGDFVLAEYLMRGEICHKCRAIHDALMASYAGDWSKVMAHVQVERFYYSRRYLTGAVIVEPQISVDAQILAMQRAPASLPAALQSITMVETAGPLVNANRGLVEFSDLLKRPLEAFKYLLGTSETAEVRMEHLILQLDEVLIATSNEIHLGAFKEIPDWASFKGRIELVRVPYLRRFEDEVQIYRDQITPLSVGKHIAPHAVEAAAMWAVLTRLKKPIADRYPEEVRAIVDEVLPAEKLRLYDTGEPPARLSMPQAKELKRVLGDLYRESHSYPHYEGREGASAREIKTVLFNAAQRPGRACLTPISVLEELEALVKEKSVYAFLQQEIMGGYHDHESFVEVVRERWLDRVDDEVRDALGLVAEEQYRDWFERYIHHVTAWVRGEKIKNRVTGESDPPDGDMMAEMEAIVMGDEDDREDFRRGLITTIGAHRLEHPAEEGGLDYPKIFPELFRHLRDHYHEERRRQLRRVYEAFLEMLDAGPGGGPVGKERAQVEEMLGGLVDKHGYCESCARDAILALMKRRYPD